MKYVNIENETLVITVVGDYKFSLTKAIDYEVQTAYQNGCTKVVVDAKDMRTLDYSAIRQLAKIYHHVRAENFAVKNARGLVLAALKSNGLEFWLK